MPMQLLIPLDRFGAARCSRGTARRMALGAALIGASVQASGCQASLDLDKYDFRARAGAAGVPPYSDVPAVAAPRTLAPLLPAPDAGAPIEPAPPARAEAMPDASVPDARAPDEITPLPPPDILAPAPDFAVLDALPAPSLAGSLRPGEALQVGSVLPSANGYVQLRLASTGLVLAHRQFDGELVDRWLFPVQDARVAVLRVDGHFVIYANDGSVSDPSSSAGPVTNAVVRVQNDGNVVLYDNAGVPPRNAPWASSTFMARSGECRRLNPNEAILAAEPTHLTSCNGAYFIQMEADGSLAVHDSAGFIYLQPLAAGGAGAITLMQPDGNLVIYDVDDVAHGASGTFPLAGSYAALEDDGSFVVYGVDDVRLWPPQ
jgi:hypothetical protein